MQPGQPVDVSLMPTPHLESTCNASGGGTGSVFSLLPPETPLDNYVNRTAGASRIDLFDHVAGQDFNAEGAQTRPVC